ncbi:MAG: thiamine pyrophosphate-binding protein [Nitrososphaerota archaeon]|nr:thiamine pyrophosphate-binding protein [Nitrososphaerota archaeon]
MKAWKTVVDALVKEKSEFAFGLVSGPWEFWDYLDDTDIRPVLVRHELSSVQMAIAHARLTGKPGIAMNSPGPGVANMFTGFLEAHTGCMPVIAPVPSSEMRTEGMAQMQETDMVSSFRPVSKWAYRITKTEKVGWGMRRAFSLATSGKPGPIFLEIPIDVGNAEYKGPPYRRVVPGRSRPDDVDVKAAARLIAKSERPAIVAGGGVVLSGASGALTELAESLLIPVLTTASGRGCIPEDHPLAFGMVGLYRTAISKKVYQEADLLITVGSKNEEFATAAWNYYPQGAKMIQIDVDPFEIGRNFIPDVSLVGDAKLALRDLVAFLATMIRMDTIRSQRVADLKKAKREYEEMVDEECKTDAVPIRTKRVVHELNKVFGRNTILANENGSQDLWAYYFPYYKVLDAGGFMGMAEQTCFGMGVVGSIAAKLTRPDMKVVCTTGDTAFQFSMKEVPTAVQYNAPVTWVLLDNAGLGWEVYYQKYWLESGKVTATKFTAQPDFVKFAEANHIYGERVEKPGDIKGALKRALKENGSGTPALLDFAVGSLELPEGFHEFHRIAWGKPKHKVRHTQ